MKATVAGLILLASLGAYAQGTVLFANFAASYVNAPVLMGDGTTPLSGGTYTAALLAGPTPSSVTLIATTPVLSGGYFNGGAQSIPNVVGGGVADVIIEVWNSALFPSFAAAQASWCPNTWGWTAGPLQIKTGNPAGTPATPPTPLLSLYIITLDVPIGGSACQPVISESYNLTSGTVNVWFTGTLQTSTNLINWTTVTNTPQTLTNTSPQTFPANQAQQYFRATAAGP